VDTDLTVARFGISGAGTAYVAAREQLPPFHMGEAYSPSEINAVTQ